MKNNIIKLIIIFCIIVNFPSTLAQEQFNFSITEIEIFEKGNKFRGLKRGTITTNNGISLDAGAASNFTTSAGALTLTSAAAATWSVNSGNLTLGI